MEDTEKTELKSKIMSMAMHSNDPINFIYEIEDLLAELTENFDWIDTFIRDKKEI